LSNPLQCLMCLPVPFLDCIAASLFSFVGKQVCRCLMKFHLRILNLVPE
jgi:hypothetical protein